MRRVLPSRTEHPNLNPRLKYVLRECDNLGISFNFKLEDRLHERGLSTKKASEMTGLRLATVSDFCTGRKGSINLQHLLLLMLFLRTTDIRDIIDIEFPENITIKYEKERNKWIYAKETPEDVVLFKRCIECPFCDDECTLQCLEELVGSIKNKLEAIDKLKQ